MQSAIEAILEKVGYGSFLTSQDRSTADDARDALASGSLRVIGINASDALRELKQILRQVAGSDDNLNRSKARDLFSDLTGGSISII